MEVKWLERALDDLRNIAEFVARDNPKAARSLVAAIRERTESLASFPFLGRASERAADVRELVVHDHYLVTYRVRPRRIEVLQVWHTARDRSASR